MKFNLKELQELYEQSPSYLKTRAVQLEKIDKDISLLESHWITEQIFVERTVWCKEIEHELSWLCIDDTWQIFVTNKTHSSYFKKIPLKNAHPLAKLELYKHLPQLYKALLGMN